MPIEARREQVLDAALRLIAEHGYGATSMEAIAREAGIAKPVVYNAYPGRGPLLRALLEREEARALGTLAAAMPPPPLDADPRAALIAWLRGLADAIRENPAPWRLILLPAEGTPEVVREHVERGRALALAQVKTLVSALLEEHAALASLDRELAAHSLLAVSEQAARLMIERPGEYPSERLVGFAEEVLRAFRNAAVASES